MEEPTLDTDPTMPMIDTIRGHLMVGQSIVHNRLIVGHPTVHDRLTLGPPTVQGLMKPGIHDGDLVRTN